MASCQFFTYAATCTAIFVAIFLWQFYRRTRRLPPGPWNLPIIGYLPWMDPIAPNICLTKLSQKFGPIFGLYMGSFYTVVVSDVKLMKKIFMKDESSGRPNLYLFQQVSKYNGVLLSEGDLWKNQRRFVLNFLKSRGASNIGHNRDKLEKAITAQVMDFIQFVQDKGEQTLISPCDILMHDVGSLSSLMLLDSSWPRDDPTWNELMRAFRELPHLISVGATLNFLPFLRCLPYFRGQIKAVNIAAEGLLGTFKTLIEQPRHSSVSLVDAFFNEKNKRDNNSRRFFTDEQLNYVVNDFFMASLETSVTSISWCLLFLAAYQEVQTKVRQEMSESLQGEPPSLEDLPRLPYLEAAIAETARIRTVVPMGIPHCAMEDVEVDEYVIPKGTVIMKLIWAVHMDPDVWGDPENFRPERFINEEGKFVKSEHFIPFSTGKRMCLGEDLAKIMVFLFVANIVKHFRIDCGDEKVDLAGCCGVTNVPKPHKLRFTKL